jgi:hypothetical protein
MWERCFQGISTFEWKVGGNNLNKSSATDDCLKLFFSNITNSSTQKMDLMWVSELISQNSERKQKSIWFCQQSVWQPGKKLRRKCDLKSVSVLHCRTANLQRDKRLPQHTDHKNLHSHKRNIRTIRKSTDSCDVFTVLTTNKSWLKEAIKISLPTHLVVYCVITIVDDEDEEHQDLCALDSNNDEGGVNTTPILTGMKRQSFQFPNSSTTTKYNKWVHKELIGHHGVDENDPTSEWQNLGRTTENMFKFTRARKQSKEILSNRPTSNSFFWESDAKMSS